MNRVIASEVQAFIDAVANELAALTGEAPARRRREAVADAAALVAAVVAADGRCTDDELWAYLECVGPELDPPLTVTPAQLRETRLFTGKEAWLERPSTLFDLLVRADARDGSVRSHHYYETAMRLAHATAAADLMPSPDEIGAIDRFRGVLLAALDGAGVRRPGTPAPVAPAPVTPAATPSPRVSATAGPPVGPPPAPVTDAPAEPLESLLAELDALVGLVEVKAEVRRLTSLLQVQQLRFERGLPTFETSHHLVFTGNPGTGKTTVARLMSRIYRTLGLVTRGHLVESDRSQLVAGYVGQTAAKTRAVLESALGGTLLIDEAYALARGGENDFGLEAVDTLVKFMEDHRDDVAIVVAGYPSEMQDFVDANPGLKSRFTRTLRFADYSTDELVEIFARLGERSQYEPTEGALAVARAMIASEPRDRGFGNARYVRNLFEAAIAHQAARLAPLLDVSTEQLTTLTADDVVVG